MGKGPSKNKSPYLAQECEDHEGSINCLEISSDGSVLATGSDDGHIRLWTTKTDMVECIGVLEGHGDYITCLVIVDNWLVSGSADKQLRKWDMSTCECVQDYVGHDSTINKVMYKDDMLFSVSYDKTARLWDFETGECLRVFTGHGNNVNSLLCIKNVRKAPTSKDKRGDKQPQQQPQSAKSRNEIADPAVTQNILITGSLDCTARSWSVQVGSCLNLFNGHKAAVTSICLDKLDKTLFTASADCRIMSWDVDNGDLMTIFKGHESPVLSLKYYKAMLYSSSADHTIRSWATEFGECVRIFKDHGHSVPSFIIDDGLIFSCCGDGIARCYDAKSASLKREYKNHKGCINGLRVMDDRMFSVSFDTTMCVWNVADVYPEKKFGKNGKSKRITLSLLDSDGGASSSRKQLRKQSYGDGDSPVSSEYREPTRVNVKRATQESIDY